MSIWEEGRSRFLFAAHNGKETAKTLAQRLYRRNQIANLKRNRKRSNVNLDDQKAALYAAHETIKKQDLKPFVTPPRGGG